MLNHSFGPKREGWCYQDIMRWPPHHDVASTLSRQLEAIERRRALHWQLEAQSNPFVQYTRPADFRRFRRPPG